MVEIVRNGLEFKFVNLSPVIQHRSEYLLNRITGELLTNPLETIINCLAESAALSVIAKVLLIEPTHNNLEELFDSINLVYYQTINDNSMIA